MGIIKLFPTRESLVSDIPAGDGKIDNLFYSVAIAENKEFISWKIEMVSAVASRFSVPKYRALNPPGL